MQVRRFVPQAVVSSQEKVPYERIQNPPWDAEQNPPQRKLGQIVSVDSPPGLVRPWLPLVGVHWAQEESTPRSVAHFIPTAQVSDSPPPKMLAPEAVRQAWEPPEVTRQALRFAPQEVVVATERVAFRRVQTTEGWDVSLVQIWVKGLSTSEAEVFKTPFSRAWIAPVIGAWQPPDELRQAQRFIPQEQVAAPEKIPFQRAQNPFGDEPTPHQQRRLGQIVSVDAPPLSVRPWVNTVLSWAIPDWYAQSRQPKPQEFVATDAPPVTSRPWLMWVTDQWSPAPYPPQGWRFVVQGTAAAVNNPPFGIRPWLLAASLAWEPAPPEPRQAIRVVTESGVSPPVQPDAGGGWWPDDVLDSLLRKKRKRYLDELRAAQQEQIEVLALEYAIEKAKTVAPARTVTLENLVQAPTFEKMSAARRLDLEQKIQEIQRRNRLLQEDDEFFMMF
jgi:hypothetical protein